MRGFRRKGLMSNKSLDAHQRSLEIQTAFSKARNASLEGLNVGEQKRLPTV